MGSLAFAAPEAPGDAVLRCAFVHGSVPMSSSGEAFGSECAQGLTDSDQRFAGFKRMTLLPVPTWAG